MSRLRTRGRLGYQLRQVAQLIALVGDAAILEPTPERSPRVIKVAQAIVGAVGVVLVAALALTVAARRRSPSRGTVWLAWWRGAHSGVQH